MTSTSHVGTIFKQDIPQISKDDLFAFHEAHFSHHAVASFGGTFLSPPGEVDDEATQGIWEEEEDDLGYYEDGVKRTLTDEQIEIFRHSELEALRKRREKQADAKPSISSDEAMDMSDMAPLEGATSSATRINKKKKKKKGAKRAQPEPKPDLRKRTWDVVDKGLDTLEYD